jgi:hypothetical protein
VGHPVQRRWLISKRIEHWWKNSNRKNPEMLRQTSVPMPLWTRHITKGWMFIEEKNTIVSYFTDRKWLILSIAIKRGGADKSSARWQRPASPGTCNPEETGLPGLQNVLITPPILRIWPRRTTTCSLDWKTKQLKGRHFSSDAEVIAAAETWLDGKLSEFFFW